MTYSKIKSKLISIICASLFASFPLIAIFLSINRINTYAELKHVLSQPAPQYAENIRSGGLEDAWSK